MRLRYALLPRRLRSVSSTKHNQDELEGVNEFVIIASSRKAYATHHP